MDVKLANKFIRIATDLEGNGSTSNEMGLEALYRKYDDVCAFANGENIRNVDIAG